MLEIMKTKSKKKKVIDFGKANDKLVFEIFRALQDIKNEIPNLKIKIKKRCS